MAGIAELLAQPISFQRTFGLKFDRKAKCNRVFSTVWNDESLGIKVQHQTDHTWHLIYASEPAGKTLRSIVRIENLKRAGATRV